MSDQGKQGTRAQPLVIFLFFIMFCPHGTAFVQTGKKGESSSGSREPKDALFHFV
jgi:hypothetical protein